MKQSSFQISSPRSRSSRSARSRAPLIVVAAAIMFVFMIAAVGLSLLVKSSTTTTTPKNNNNNNKTSHTPSLRLSLNETVHVVVAKPTTTLSSPRIPHTLFFTYKHNILETKEPKHFYDNVMNTIHEYQTLWNEPNAPVRFLDDAACIYEITVAEPRLVQHFSKTKAGAWKADICRIAALYNHGGYYFDVDLKVVQPVDLTGTKQDLEFVTVHESARYLNFFQAFIAASRQHDVLKSAMYYMLEHFENRLRLMGNLGPYTLKRAYKDLPSTSQTWILHELNLDHPKSPPYPNVARQVGDGCCCNFVVEDEEARQVYFYSRFPGASNFCKVPANDEQIT